MSEIISWFTENWGEVAVAVLAIYGGAAAIIRLTPTKKDDGFLAKYITPWMTKLEGLTQKNKDS